MKRLDQRDDPAYWRALIDVVLADIDARWADGADGVRSIAVAVSRVRHWERPHQSRWLGGGGFAWPKSYGPHAEVEADWTQWIGRARGDDEWSPLASEPRSRRGAFRAWLAAPADTVRHDQAASLLKWRPSYPFATASSDGALRQMHGFRREATAWSLVAEQEF